MRQGSGRLGWGKVCCGPDSARKLLQWLCILLLGRTFDGGCKYWTWTWVIYSKDWDTWAKVLTAVSLCNEV